VNAPGWYGIPRILGNLYKNGVTSDTPITYKGSEPATQYVLTAFTDYKDQPIISGSTLNSNGGSVAALWMDAPDLVTQVGFSAQYVRFYVDPATIKQGNAVIAMRDADGTIMWSWHIWVTPLVNAAAPATKTAVNSFGQFEFMEYNLGWVEENSTRYGTGTLYDQPRTVQVRISQTGISNPASTTFTVTQTPGEVHGPGTNTYYQWGRKDPFPGGANGATLETAAVYYPAGATATLAFQETPGLNIPRATIMPYLFMGGNKNWLSVANAKINLWNTNVTGVSTNGPVTKTVYDPCPAGFSVPEENAFSGFSTASIESWVNGGNNLYLDPNDHAKGTIHFPTPGRRSSANGNMEAVNIYTYYWSASPSTENSNTSDRYGIYLANKNVQSGILLAASYGASVRCVKN
jgi:hypothetical protein